MKKIIGLYLSIFLLASVLNIAITQAQTTEYARYIASMDNLVENVPLNFSKWDAVQVPVNWEITNTYKHDGEYSMKIVCPDNELYSPGMEWHSTGYWLLDAIYGDLGGSQYLEFWIKNDTGFNFGLQIQMIERGKDGNPSGEPWRTKVETTVLYEDNGEFISRTSDVSDSNTYNELSASYEGAVAIPKDFEGRIRIAINQNNFYRATWFTMQPGDGSNNAIDRDKIAHLSFTYDLRTVPSNAAWYLDSIKVVAPNTGIKNSVLYSELNPMDELNNKPQATPTSQITPSTTNTPAPTVTNAATPTTIVSNSETPTETSIESEVESEVESSISDSSSLEISSDVNNSSEISESAEPTSQNDSETESEQETDDENKKSNALPIIAVIIIVVVAGGALLYFLKFKKS